tara:strand:- start:3281 stop:3568 length:288 start_codon:yes stop_codon:yes gene_type:complete
MKESTTFKFTRFREKVKDRPRYNRQKEKHFDMERDAVKGLNSNRLSYIELAEELRRIADKITGATTTDSRTALSHQIGLIASSIEQLIDKQPETW